MYYCKVSLHGVPEYRELYPWATTYKPKFENFFFESFMLALWTNLHELFVRQTFKDGYADRKGKSVNARAHMSILCLQGMD